MKEALHSMTNALDGINGHLNHIVSGNNTFWGSLCRLVSQSESGTDRFSIYVRHYLDQAKPKALVLSHSLAANEINAQVIFYEMTAEICRCGQTTLLSNISDIDIPCCHRLSLRVPQPKLAQSPRLYFEDPGKAFTLDSEFHERQDAERIPGKERNAYLDETAISNIKRLSHTGKKKAEILEWVTGCWSASEYMTTFVGKIRLAIVALIPEGVFAFGR
jgi:hypothetical protein